MSASSRSEPSRGPLRSVAHWAPVWLPLALGIQIAILGLRPALQEERRLEGEREALRARQAELLAERAELDERLRAQADPLFLERERRALRHPDGFATRDR